MNFYLVRIGNGWKFIENARKNWYIAIDFDSFNLWDLSKYNNLEDIKKAVAKVWNYTTAQIAIQSWQLNRFFSEMKNGDAVVSPVWDWTYIVWEVGEYFYMENSTDGCPYPYRRHVKWLDVILNKEDMSTNFIYSLWSMQTIYSLNKYGDEIQKLMAWEVYSPAEKPTRIRDIILTNLLSLDGKQFEEFLTHILDVIWFESETTQYVRDWWIDVIGTLYADGLADIKLKIQAKRYEKWSIGDNVVRELRGTLELDEHGCIITTSTFSKPAREEANKERVKSIKLIDWSDLASLILRHFDDIDDKYKSILGIRKKHEYNIEDQFEGNDYKGKEILWEVTKNKEEIKFDTIICPAKEDWFQEAFLDKKARWAVRIDKTKLDKIKYIAMYQVAPISAITYYGKVKKIEPYENTGKYILHLDGDPIKLDNSIKLWDDPSLSPQWSKYGFLQSIKKAKTLKDLV